MAENGGSSPRVRGKRHSHDHTVCPVGLIPARAGKTTAETTSLRQTAAHPRACGENCAVAFAPSLIRGSSPRVRGKRGHPGQRRH